MRKKLNIKILNLIIMLLLAAVPSYSLDAPHNATNNISCDSCHYTYGSEPSLLIESLSYGLDIDDTQYNALCWSCHNDVTAPFVRTHSSLQIDNGYGDWSMECRTCHNPHTQKQVSTYKTTGYLYQATVSAVDATTLTESGAGWTVDEYAGMILIPNIVNYRTYNYTIISNTSDTITVNGPITLSKVTAGDTFAIAYGKLVKNSIATPNSGNKTVKLFDATGTNSFADGDSTYDGVCEGCHTQTEYHKNGAAGDHSHNAGLKCSECHTHVKGFNIQCNVCHGFPPTVNAATGGPDGLANLPAATGSATAGAHDRHVTTKEYECTACHYNSNGNGSTHNNSQIITMGFNMFSGAQQGGSYDGQVGVNYNTTTTSPVTAVSNTGSKGCSTVYCHSTGQSTTDENSATPTYASPVWDTPASAACGTCHKVTEASGLTSGSHGQHLGTTGVSGCADCHTGAQNDASAYNSSNHVNAAIDVANTYTAGGTPGNGYGTCSTASCHEDGTGSVVVTPSWGATSACAACHAAAPATGSHTKHLSTTNYNTADCADCHESAVQGTIAPAEHLDGDLDVYDSSAGDLGYPADVAKGGAPYDSCSTAYCHSTGQSTSDGSSSTPTYATVTWGGTAACGTCHKVTEASGLTSGSHAEHLGSTGVSGCADCHTGAENDASANDTITHVDGTIDVDNTYTAGGAPGNGYGTCSTASCHDDTTGTMIASPTWGADLANCTQCHDAAPSTGSHTSHLAASGVACNDCHENAVESTTAPAQHLDSNIDVYDTTAGDLGYPADKAKNSAFTNCTTASCHDDGTGTVVATPVWGTDDANCTQCHAAVPTSGSHTKHVSTTNYNTADCADCHKGAVQSTTVPDQHLDTNVDVYTSIAGDLGYPANKTKGSAYTSCSTAYCHSTGQSTSDGSSSAPSYATVTWGDTAVCGTCHKVTEASGLTSGSHGAHLGTSGVNGCADCHTGAENDASAYNSTSHVNASIDVANTYTAGGAPGNGYGTCSAASCHDDGTGTPAVTPAWGTTTAACTECHDAAPATGSHTAHLATSGVACNDCHDNAVESTTAPTQHMDSNIDVFDSASGDLGYPENKTKGSAYSTCSTASCHDDGTGTLVATPTWGTSTTACTECHDAAPSTGSHSAHLAASGVACNDCHDNAVESTTAPTQHLDTNIDVFDSASGDLGYTENKTKGSAYTNCTTASCHDDGTGTLVATSVWGTDDANCTQCHAAAPATGSHTKHLSTTNYNTADCADCHESAVQGTTAPAQHLDGDVDIYDSAAGDLGYPQDVTKGGAPYDTCSTAYCHSTGQSTSDGSSSTPTYATVTWGDTAACGTCHKVTEASGLTSGSHAEHLGTSGVNGCADCHTGAQNDASAYNSTNHVNASIEVANTYSAAGAPGNGYGTCSAASCHDDGTGTPTVTPAWGTDAANCTQCHAAAPTTGSHTKHLSTTNYNTADCADCHESAVQGTTAPAQHLDNNIDVYDTSSGDLGYTENKTKGSAYTSCSTAYCHSTGQSTSDKDSSTPTYATVTWGDSAACGTCHKVTEASGLTSGSHAEHLGTAGVSGCAACHTGAENDASAYNSTSHVNASIDVANSYTASGAPGNDYGTCSVAACHGTQSPTWGTDFTGIDTCTKCHGTATASPAADYKKAPPKDLNGDTAATDAQVGAHQAHLQSSISNNVACNQCHTVPAAVSDAGHINDGTPGTAELTFGALASSNGASPVYSAGECSSVYCHGGALPGGSTDGADETPIWSDTTYLTGSAANDCSRCHGYPPSSQGVHSGKGPTDCITCHNYGVNASGTGFTDVSNHINSSVNVGGSCSTCHSSSGGPTPGTTPDEHHGLHIQTPYVGTTDDGDYGNYTTNNWYGYSNTGGVPNKKCGYCHPQSSATHMDGKIDLNFDPADPGAAGTMKAKNNPTQSYTQVEGSSVTCSSVYCHSSGYNDGSGYEYKTSPNWYGGSFTGDKCDDCHGNMPDTSSHMTHGRVAIHYDTIYEGTSGLLSDGGGVGSGAGHGDPNTSTTINCNLCHNNVVTVAYNDQNTVCAVCHAGTPVGTMIIDPSATSHVTGTADIDFADVTIRSRAQIRDDITTVTELNTYWQRNNGYKQGTSSHDSSKATLASQATYSSGTCSTVSCHNGNDIDWDTNISSCAACHIDVPRTDQ